MEVIQTPIADLVIIKPRIFEDERGFFCETYNRDQYKKQGIHQDFCQDNQSKSTYGVIRGLHYQLLPHSQSKLVSVNFGAVWDIAVDLRKDSPTFGQWYAVELSAENKLQFLIPQGFAHGFSVISEFALFSYKCDNYYNQASERGISFKDPILDIDWKIPLDKALVSPKDQGYPLFKDAEFNF